MEKLLEIRTLLLNDSINYSEAYGKIKKLPKPWHTKNWKDLRKKHLKDKCENCNSTKQPLVIQHTIHPSDFYEFYNTIMDKYVNLDKVITEVLKTKETKLFFKKYLKENSEKRGTCPICGNITLRKRKKDNMFICAKDHTFETPVVIFYYTKARTQDPEIAMDDAIRRNRNLLAYPIFNDLKAQYDLQVGKEALLLTIEEGIEYRQFKNIKTCCKRCAAIEDGITIKLVLCEKCKIEYHNPTYETCYNCRIVI